MDTLQTSTDLDRLLVSTKFAPPRIGSRHVLRESLLGVLGRERHCRLLLVTGSAGFGKTTLLAQWRRKLMEEGAQVAWLSLHSDEKGYSNFRTHLLVALGRLGMHMEDDFLLGQEGPSQIEETVATIVNNIGSMGVDIHLMLDDYHHVEDPRAHQLLQKLIDHCPSNLHLVIASRAIPPLSLARIRVMGQMAEIECGSLPFNLVETRAFLAQNAQIVKLAPEEIGIIHDQTNGWPASLQLVAIMLKNRPELRASLSSLAWHSSDLQNYLWEDVVSHLPAEMITFMEELSICRRFNASLAGAISGTDHAANFIERIEEENLLIMRADVPDRSPWYRFHPLFNEFLAARLARRRPDRVAMLHRRASEWFQTRRLVIEAVRHATLAGDIPEAVTIIERAVPGSWKLSYLGPLLHLADHVSLDAIAARPHILYLGSITLAMTGATARANDWLARLRDCTAAATGPLVFQTALVEATIAFQRDDIEECITRLSPFSPDDAPTSFERYVFLMVKVTAFAIVGEIENGLALLQRSPILVDDFDDDMAMRASGCRTVALLIAGRVSEAETISTPHYTRCAALHGRTSTSASLAAASLAIISYELDRIDDARELVASRQTHRQTSSPQMMIWATLCRARLDRLQDSADTALIFLERQGGYFRSLGIDRCAAHCDAEQVHILLASGRIEAAGKMLRRLRTLVDASICPTHSAEMSILLYIAEARMELSADRPEVALDHANAAKVNAKHLGRSQLEVTASLLAVRALDLLGRDQDAARRLRSLATLGERMGLIRTFLDEDARLIELLRQLDRNGRLEERVRSHFAAALGPLPLSGEKPDSNTVEAAANSPLTGREIEIIGLVAAGMSNKRIALTLQISVETVKWNLKNIFIKLGVSSRYDAMIWARRQGLID